MSSEIKEDVRIHRRNFLKKLLGGAAAGTLLGGSVRGADKGSNVSGKPDEVMAGDAPFVGEICLVPYNFVPYGWLECDGTTYPVSTYSTLFAAIGYSYGGSGSVFAVPDLKGRSLLHAGGIYGFGVKGGEASHILTSSEMPAHTHAFGNASYGTSDSPAGLVPARNAASETHYAALSGNSMAYQPALAGGDTAHNNMPPYLVLRYIIAWDGIFPERP